MTIVKDRRASLRVTIEGRATVHTERDSFEVQCIDLGLEGLAVRSTRSPRSRTVVTIEALIDGQRLRFDATPARRQRQDGSYVLGFSFVELDLDTRRRIEHLVFERLARSPRAGFMRAFVAHAERVPPPPLAPREDISDRTVVAHPPNIPVISGHTQIAAVGQLPFADRTMIAPPPPRSDTVHAGTVIVHEPAPVMAPVAFDDSWVDDEMDTAQFRLLEAAQQRERALESDDDLVLELEPEPEPEPEPQAPQETTVVTHDAEDRPRAEKTAVLSPAELVTAAMGAGVPQRITPTHTPTMALVLELGAHPPLERSAAPDPTLPVRLEPPTVPPLLRGDVTTTRVAPARAPAALMLRPSLRALLDAAAMLRRPATPARRGPRVIVAIPHRTYRRSAAMPWNG